VNLEAGRHVLGNGGGVALPDRARPDGRVGTYQHSAPTVIARSLNDTMEQVLGGLGPAGNPVLLIPVELRADHERHVRVAEVAEQLSVAIW
jgi:hypothetical protein